MLLFFMIFLITYCNYRVYKRIKIDYSIAHSIPLSRKFSQIIEDKMKKKKMWICSPFFPKNTKKIFQFWAVNLLTLIIPGPGCL